MSFARYFWTRASRRAGRLESWAFCHSETVSTCSQLSWLLHRQQVHTHSLQQIAAKLKESLDSAMKSKLFTIFCLLIRRTVGRPGPALVRRLDKGSYSPPCLLQIPLHKGSWLAPAGAAACRGIGWQQDHWQEPGETHHKSHRQRRFQGRILTLGGLPRTIPKPCPLLLCSWMDPGVGLPFTFTVTTTRGRHCYYPRFPETSQDAI